MAISFYYPETQELGQSRFLNLTIEEKNFFFSVHLSSLLSTKKFNVF